MSETTATLSPIRIKNIVSYTVNYPASSTEGWEAYTNADVYQGIRSVQLQADIGKLQPVLTEGYAFAQDIENLGTAEAPMKTQTEVETDPSILLALAAEPMHDLVIVYKPRDGYSETRVLTLLNHLFGGGTAKQDLQKFGVPTIPGMAVSSDGTTFPYAIVDG